MYLYCDIEVKMILYICLPLHVPLHFLQQSLSLTQYVPSKISGCCTGCTVTVPLPCFWAESDL